MLLQLLCYYIFWPIWAERLFSGLVRLKLAIFFALKDSNPALGQPWSPVSVMCCVYTYLISCFGQEPDPEIELASGEPSDSYQACRDYHMATRVLAANLSLCLTIHSHSSSLCLTIHSLSSSLQYVSLFTVSLPWLPGY